jgi:hypothetical protein
MRQSEANKAYVYGLIDPASHLVRYVGQTRALVERYAEHRRGAVPATHDWVCWLTATGSMPVLVVLANVECSGSDMPREVQACETKWIKRFRRTLLNRCTRDNCPAVWDALVNR